MRYDEDIASLGRQLYAAFFSGVAVRVLLHVVIRIRNSEADGRRAGEYGHALMCARMVVRTLRRAVAEDPRYVPTILSEEAPSIHRIVAGGGCRRGRG